MIVRRKIGRREFLRRTLRQDDADSKADFLAEQIRKAEERKNKKRSEEEYRGYVYGCIEKRIRRYGKY